MGSFFTDGKYIISASNAEGTLKVWDWEMKEEQQTPIILLNLLNTEEDLAYECYAFSNNNRQIAAGGGSGQILMYDVENLPLGLPIVIALFDSKNNLLTRCSYCGKVFDSLDIMSDKIVKCCHCNEELQVIIDKSNGVKNIEPVIINLLNNGEIDKAEELLFENLETNLSDIRFEDLCKLYKKLRSYYGGPKNSFSVQRVENRWKDFTKAYFKRRNNQ
jgi:WD40 repeat protein